MNYQFLEELDEILAVTRLKLPNAAAALARLHQRDREHDLTFASWDIAALNSFGTSGPLASATNPLRTSASVDTISHPIVLDRARIYVIGDVHGRSDLLHRMVDHISRDLDANPISDCMTVTLGDYIDRGPDSHGILDRLVRNPFPTDFVALKGNHEALLEMFLDDPAVADHWRRLGGLETLHSYGVPVGNLMTGANYEQAARALEAAAPDEHFRFLASLKP